MSMKYPYRDLGVTFDRQFRNDLNANFDDIEHDIRQIGGEAAQQALEAAEEANTQAIYAQTSGDYANDKGDYAAQQGDYAQTQGNFANEKGLYAQQQGDYAKAQGDYAKQVGDENKTRWLNPVATFADIATTYPNPQHGDTVMVTDDGENSGSVYRYENGQWNLTQKHNDLAIADVQNKIGILTEETKQNTYLLSTSIVLKETEGKKVNKKGYWFYQAVIKNPLKNVAYTNEIVGIRASFDLGECPSTSHIEVLDENNASIPFEWEPAKDPKTGVNYGTYRDGSLRHGTIWVETSLAPDEEKVFTIKIHENPISHDFPVSVSYTEMTEQSGDEVALLEANGITAKFARGQGWSLYQIYVNGFNINSTTNANRVAIVDNNGVDVNPTFSNSIIQNKKINGNGIMFREFEVTFQLTYNTDITINYKARMWKNGKIDFRSYAYATNDIPSGVVNGIVLKTVWNKLNLSNSKDSYKGYIFNSSSDGKSVLAGVRHMQFLSEFPGSDNGYNSYYENLLGTANIISVGWDNTGSSSKSISKGSYFSNSGYFSFNVAENEAENEVNRRINPIITRMAKDTAENLKRKFITLAKPYIETMKYWTEKNDYGFFEGLQSLQSLAFYEIFGYGEEYLNEAYTRLKNVLNRRYGNGSVQGFIDAWNGYHGWEFIGRDMAVVPHLYRCYTKLGDEVKAEEMKNIIHNLADAAVQMEVASGGDGKMNLRGNIWGDNYNAEAAALVALAESLSIEENAARRATFNRIASRFATAKEFENKTPYNQSDSANLKYSIRYPTNHYHCFNLYEAFRANDIQELGIELPSPRQYIFEFTTATGQVLEVDSNYQPTRRGFALTQIYAAAILVRWGGNVSDLEHACSLLEHVISRLKPNGDLERPLDGWGLPLFPNGDVHNAPIETQALIETIKAL
ncbi:hypothetical protein ABET52_06195 [Saccharococcus caldoxylosilyticus]|uniref:hypothetical protein n=1 Tax=Saccharococcus caldoxylosilyticus TaxID=81408 RepID=UPI003D3556C3